MARCEGPLLHQKPMCVRIWLEVGHACEPRITSPGRAPSLDWRVWVRGVCGRDISGFVNKAVFQLPEATFPYPKRVLLEPPYEIEESSCASVDIVIDLYLKYSNKPTKISIKYCLQIEQSSRCNSESRCVYFDFVKPSEQLRLALMSVGGEVMPHTGAPDASKHLVVVPSDEERRARLMKSKKYKYVEPVQCMHGLKKQKPYEKDVICSKCGKSIFADLRKQLRSVAMTDDVISHVSRLYESCSNYEKSAGALKLPPISDPIYTVPELPPSLKRALEEVKEDYVLS